MRSFYARQPSHLIGIRVICRHHYISTARMQLSRAPFQNKAPLSLLFSNAINISNKRDNKSAKKLKSHGDELVFVGAEKIN